MTILMTGGDRPLGWTRTLEEYDEVCEMIANGELCEADGRDCEYVTGYEKYGEDLDGNRGTWVEYTVCRKCGWPPR